MSDEQECKAIIVRSEVEPKSNYLEYRDQLRYDFFYSCAYCTMTEVEATAIGFNIDHYLPQKTHPQLKNNYENLMWSCEVCNRYKSDYTPSNKQEKKDHIILRPDQEDVKEHYQLEGFRLKGKTKCGEFNIDWLELNRLQLRRLREIREKFCKSNEYIESGIREFINLNIDRLPKGKRFAFIMIKKNVLEHHDKLITSLNGMLRRFACSTLIDNDPEKQKLNQNRKKYIEQQKAILGETLKPAKR